MNKQELKDKYINLMEKQTKGWDKEVEHVNADDLLCDLLEELGFEEVVEVYNKVEKWYA